MKGFIEGLSGDCLYSVLQDVGRVTAGQSSLDYLSLMGGGGCGELGCPRWFLQRDLAFMAMDLDLDRSPTVRPAQTSTGCERCGRNVRGISWNQ